jgi:ABC-type phosphate transport system substrate-binding protein
MSAARATRSHAVGGMLLVLCTILLPAGRTSAQVRGGQEIAIVVHSHVGVDNLSFADLRRIFLGEQQFWPDRSKVTLLVRAPTSRERTVVLDRIYRMDEDRFRQYWIGKMFRAEVAAGPKIVYSNDMALNLITAIRGSITFIPVSAVTPEVKVLRIDGKLPTDPGYPLQ